MKTTKKSLTQLQRIDVESFKNLKKNKIIVVLDDIRSALNVGSFFRTSDALAIEHIYLCGITARPPHKEILKTAIGATESVDWSYHESLPILLDSLGNHTIISIEQTTDSISLENIHLTFASESTYVLIFGNEVKGVSQEAIEKSNFCVEIPQFGTKHSFNVAVCGGIVLWEFWKLLNCEN